MSASADRNLLFGILALQNGFITREQLIDGIRAWAGEKSVLMEEVLIRQRALSAAQRNVLVPMVAFHIQEHAGDASKSLAGISYVESSVRDAIGNVNDPDVAASILHLAASEVDPYATKAPSVGAASVPGQRFQILRPHAQGGLGKVSIALDTELNREVALKEIQPPHADHNESRARFVLEAEVTGGLEHPGIVPVYGMGHYADGRPFYAMKFIKGDSLKEAIERYHHPKPNDPPETTGLLGLRKLLGRFIDVCNAMQYAHDRGVLHRDLKPGNIMLGQYGETLVVDWGLAKPRGVSSVSTSDESILVPSTSASGSFDATLPGSTVGTPQYMSPEQASGKLDELGPQSDVYSLGATLYHILTGQSPLAGKAGNDAGEVLRRVQRGDFPPPRSVQSTVITTLEAICLKAMALRPADRYASPRALATDIERWLDEVDERNQQLQQAIVALEAANVKAEAALKASRNHLGFSNFQHGLAEFNLGRWRSACRHLFAAWRIAEIGDPHRDSYLRILADRMTMGGQCCGLPLEHVSNVTDVAFCPHGNYVATATVGNAVQLWDSTTGIPIGPELLHPHAVVRIVFSSDGRFLAAASGGAGWVWEVASLRLAGRLIGHQGGLTDITFSPDGSLLGTTSYDRTARLWTTRDFQPASRPLPHQSTLRSIAFHPHGHCLATATEDGTAQLWDIHSRTPLGPGLRHDELASLDGENPHSSEDETMKTSVNDWWWKDPAGGVVGRDLPRFAGAWQVAFSPNGEYLATILNDKCAYVWHVPTRTLHNKLTGHHRWISHLSFSPDGNAIGTASRDTTARVWEELGASTVSECMQHAETVWNVAFSPDSTLIATASEDRTVQLWDRKTTVCIGEALRQDDPIRKVVFSPDSTRFATKSANSVHLWQIPRGMHRCQTMTHLDAVYTVAFSFDGKWLATASRDKTARIWDWNSGLLVAPPLQHQDVVRVVAFSPDDSTIATACDDGAARMWDAHRYQQLVEMRHQAAVVCVAFSPDGRRLATASRDGTVQQWDTKSGESVGKPIKHSDTVWGVAFSPDGNRLATCSRDRTARIWDVQRLKTICKPLYHSWSIHSVTFSPDGTRIATASSDRTARLWNAKNGDPISEPMRHPARVTEITFSPDGARLATSSEDGVVRLWDARTGVPLVQQFRHAKEVLGLAFSRDGQFLATGSTDFLAHIWEASELPSSNLTPVSFWEVMTCAAVEDNGDVRALSLIERSERLQMLLTDKQWFDTFRVFTQRRSEQCRRQLLWQAVDGKDAFAIRFHLGKMSDDERGRPENQGLIRDANAVLGR